MNIKLNSLLANLMGLLDNKKIKTLITHEKNKEEILKYISESFEEDEKTLKECEDKIKIAKKRGYSFNILDEIDGCIPYKDATGTAYASTSGGKTPEENILVSIKMLAKYKNKPEYEILAYLTHENIPVPKVFLDERINWYKILHQKI